MERLFSVEAVALVLGLHVQTVRRYCRGGQVSAVRFGKYWRVAAEEIERVRREGVPRRLEG